MPVYREAYDLIVYFNNLSVNLARDMRYTIAEDLKRCLIAVEVAVYRANAGSGVCRPPVVGFLSGRQSRRPKPARPPARSALGFHADARYLMVPPRFNGGRHSFDNGFAFLNVGFCYNFASSCRNISQGFSF